VSALAGCYPQYAKTCLNRYDQEFLPTYGSNRMQWPVDPAAVEAECAANGSSCPLDTLLTGPGGWCVGRVRKLNLRFPDGGTNWHGLDEAQGGIDAQLHWNTEIGGPAWEFTTRTVYKKGEWEPFKKRPQVCADLFVAISARQEPWRDKSAKWLSTRTDLPDEDQPEYDNECGLNFVLDTADTSF